MLHDYDFECTIGHTHATIKLRGQSAIMTGQILAREIEDGYETIYLDRLLVTGNRVSREDKWEATGCISTILRRRINND